MTAGLPVMEYEKAELRSHLMENIVLHKGRPGGKYLRDPCDVEASRHSLTILRGRSNDWQYTSSNFFMEV